MAKTQKFPEDLLLEAVVKFAEQERNKIKATELAEWSRNNIPGLEEVRDYHFTRPIKGKDPKTNKPVEYTKSCTVKINEINKSRSIVSSVNRNTLLKAANIDAFFELPLIVQKKLVVETRETFNKLLSKNGYLSTENEALRRQNREQETVINELDIKIKSITQKQKKLEKRLNYIIRVTDENSRREMLEKMGINDGEIDIDRYQQSISEEIGEMFDIGKTLKGYQKQVLAEKAENLAELTLKGINFD